MTQAATSPQYAYPSIDRKKHKWENDYAGFEPKKLRDGKIEFVGKCPKNFSHEEAQRLLDTAISFPKHINAPDKEKIYYAVGKDGVIYVAYITNPAIPSYHGMPWHKRGNQRLAKSLLDQLKAQAEKNNALENFEKWLKEWGGQ